MSLEVKIQLLSLELRNLSTHQLETYKNFTESAAMYVRENQLHWKDMIEEYKRSWDSLDAISRMSIDRNKTWIKMSEHMYVEGEMLKPAKALVDLGAGYYANMSLDDAKEFFERRGCYGIELVEFYQELFDKKRLVYHSIHQALKSKIREKHLKVDRENKNKK